MKIRERKEIKALMHDLVFPKPHRHEHSEVSSDELAAMEEQLSSESDKDRQAFFKETEKQSEEVCRKRRIALRVKQMTKEQRQEKIMAA